MMIEEISKKSGEYFESGYYCAESVLLAITESQKIKNDLIPKIASGLSGGISRTCGLCGAVLGAIMSINIVYGRTSADESVEINFAKVQKFLKEFESRFASINCQDLTGCDLGSDEGQAFFEANQVRKKCREYTEAATQLALTIIKE